MKIVSLLPSATEIVYALGLGDSLIGVTDECDYPPDAVTKPVISRSALPQGRPLGSREIDAAVRERMDAEQPLYVLDTDRLRREQPDVILTQDLCRVCAVPAGHVEEALASLGVGDQTKVVSLDPHSLEDVIAQLEIVGALLGAEARGKELAEVLRERVAAVKQKAQRLPSVSVFCMDWAEPPFVAGHWVPEMVEAVGAINLLSDKGEPSHTVTHREIRDAMPEVLLFMPCGYYLEEAEEEGERVLAHPEIADTPAARNGNVFAVDATSFFSRPGPRIVDGLEIVAWAAHPEAYPEPSPGSIARLR
ncbi:MAG TPA: cobalamin-binding protein [Actinomycetota bacterium]|nr:cobalamin-binding protein [Actinomycetota bacterium]